MKVKLHRRNDTEPEPLIELMNLISDDKLLLMFKTIFLAHGDTSGSLRSQLKLSRRQYYSRMSRLTKAGLVKREKGTYIVTAFGKVIYDAQRLITSAIRNQWKLKAIDSLGASPGEKMPEEERNQIIELMIGNQQIKNILFSRDF